MSASNPDVAAGARDGVPIAELAESRLKTPPYKVLGEVSCRFDDGRLTLCGHVPSHYHKQLAQTAISQFAAQRDEVREVVNRIEVDQPR